MRQSNNEFPNITELDKTICKLESLGSILIRLVENESQEPDFSELADLGRIISEQAMTALDLLHDQRPPIHCE